MSSLISEVLNWGFRRYVRRFVRKSFNAVRISGHDSLSWLPAVPTVCFVNHPGWWDPMTAVLMTDLLFPTRRFAAPMDAEALSRYPILERLGFFPVQRETASGAKEFLRSSRRVLENPSALLWITPAGKFQDVRQRTSFMNGLGHLVHSGFAGNVLPMAIEYTFWDERSPELLVRFGSTVDCAALSADRDLRCRRLEEALAETQAALAQLAIGRDADCFTTVLEGRAGIGGIYDGWRRAVAVLRGQRFQIRHRNDSAAMPGTVKGEPL